MHLDVVLGHAGATVSVSRPAASIRWRPFAGTPARRPWVAITTRSSTPSSATSARSVATLQLRESSNTAAPRAALPSPSLSDSSHTRARKPTSDQPAGDRNHGGTLSLLHHRIVDRDRLGGGERIGVQLDKAEVAPGFGDGIGDGLDACRRRPCDIHRAAPRHGT